jgi:hypothetical protein
MKISGGKSHDGNKIKKHTSQVVLASALEVAARTMILFGKTILVLVFHALGHVTSYGPMTGALESVEDQVGNFMNGL